MPTAKVVTFPSQAQRQRLRLPEEVVITFPFSQDECAVINAHLRERSPEICIGIDDPRVQDVIERFMEYIWTTCEATKATLVNAF